MKAVIGTLIDMGRVIYAVRFEGRLIVGPSGVDSCIQLSIVEQKRGLDFGDLLSSGLPTIEGNRRGQIGEPYGKRVGHASPEAEAHNTDSPAAFGM